MISGGARSISNMMNMSFGNRSMNASKGRLMESDDEGESDDEDYLRHKSDEASDTERKRGGRFSFSRKKRTDSNASSEQLQISPATSPKRTLGRSTSSNVAVVTKSPAQGPAQLVFVNNDAPTNVATSADTSNSPVRKSPEKSKSTGMMGMMFMGDMEGGDALLKMQCAASIAAPKAAKSKRQKNKDVLEAYNAKMAAKKAAKKAKKALEESGEAGDADGKQRIKIRIRVPKGSDPALIAAMAQKMADQQQSLELAKMHGKGHEKTKEDDSHNQSASNQSASNLRVDALGNMEDPPTTPKTPTPKKLVTATFSNMSSKVKSPRTPRTPSRGKLRTPRTPRTPRSSSNKSDNGDTVSPTQDESPSRIVPLRAPSNESLTKMQQANAHQEKAIEEENSMSEMNHSAENLPATPTRRSKSPNIVKSPQSPKSPKSPKSPNSSPTKSPTRKNISRSRSVRKMIAEREKQMKPSDNNEIKPHRSSPTRGSTSLRRQKSSRSRAMKAEDKALSDSPVQPRRQKSIRSKSGRFQVGSATTNPEDEKSILCSTQTVAAVPSSTSPRRLHREQSSPGKRENPVVPESSSRQYPQSPKTRTRRIHSVSLRRLATEERGHDSMKASASVASASIATVPNLGSATAATSTGTGRSTVLRKPFRDTPSRRRGTEVAPGTPRKRPQRTESGQSVQARIRQLNASVTNLG
jgi:hypothetical protein